MKVRRLFRKTRFFFLALFGAIALSFSILSIATVSRELQQEYEGNSRSIAKSIADSSVDILLNRNLATLQSLIDQFIEIESIRYIYITGGSGEFLAHTFVPGIPDEILASDPSSTETVERSLPGMGDFVEVGSPILSGVAGTVHVGMDRELLGLKIQRAVGQQMYLFGIILVVGTVLSFVFVRLAANPLADLVRFAARLTEEKEVTGKERVLARDDEVGDLARLMLHLSYGPGPSRRDGD